VSQIDVIENEIATRFVSARKNALSFLDYPSALPQTLEEAYAIQDAAIAAFHGRICGWKVGRINAPRCDALGTTRLFGPVWAEALQDIAPGARPVGRIFDGGFGAVEAEYIFRIGTAPAPGKTQFTREDAATLVDAVFVGFEIASSPFRGINTLGPLVTISDFGNNNGLILGPEIPDWHQSGLEDWAVETRADGAVLGNGSASSFPGGLLESVRLLLENLVARGYPVTPGLLVSTGAVTGVHEVTAGQQIEARFGDFASIACTIDYAEA
jgi:2-keto-4-pentenoate hydratase